MDSRSSTRLANALIADRHREADEHRRSQGPGDPAPVRGRWTPTVASLATALARRARQFRLRPTDVIEAPR